MSEETYETIIKWVDMIGEFGADAAAAALSEIPVIGPILGWGLVHVGVWFLKKLIGLIPREGDNDSTSFKKQQELYRAVLHEDERLRRNQNKVALNAKLAPNRSAELVPTVVMGKDISGNLQAPKMQSRNNNWKYNRPILPILYYPKSETELATMQAWISRGLPLANPIGFTPSVPQLTQVPIHVW
jgi:hypothetical protein